MAYSFWGQSPATTTVSASPSPTNTIFTVASATDLLPLQYITVRVGGIDERAQILSKSGNQITLVSALSGVPDVPGLVRSGRELVKNSKLNIGWVGIAASIADLASTALTNAVNYLKAHLPGYGLYMLNPDATYPADSEMAITNGSYQWTMDVMGSDLVESIVQEYLSPLFTEIDILRTEVDRLTALSAYTLETYIVRENLNISILTTGTGAEILIPIVPAILTELRASDMVTLQSFPVPAGIVVGAVSLQGGYVSIRIWNPTAGSITPGIIPTTIKIQRTAS